MKYVACMGGEVNYTRVTNKSKINKSKIYFGYILNRKKSPQAPLQKQIKIFTWTCCFCVFNMFGSIDSGPSTLIINSFSTSHWLN